jgi:hypothetical protein
MVPGPSGNAPRYLRIDGPDAKTTHYIELWHPDHLDESSSNVTIWAADDLAKVSAVFSLVAC